MFEMLNKIDRKLRERLEAVASKAVEFNDQGVFDWALRASSDALALGRMRDRDLANLTRLEETYNHDFYRRNEHCGTGSGRVYA